MGKRNANDNGEGHLQHNQQQNSAGPNSKRAKLNGHHHNNIVDISTVENDTLSSSPVLMLDNSDSPKPEFQLSRELVNGTILTDLAKKKWRIGNPIGKGSFGEIFLASDDISSPVTGENAKYVAKIEPHSNGPLFVEIHCLLNTAKHTDDHPLPPGMPEYIASGSHYFKSNRYRFLILKRFDRDLHSIIKNRRVNPKSVLILAVQILDVLQHLHDKGYCHSDIKAENLMISKCTFQKNEVNSNNTVNISCGGSSSNGEDEDDDEEDEEEEEEESEDNHKTPVTKRRKTTVQYSGSNPVRSCRLQKRNSTYQEMLKTHYLRPTKKINYAEFFNDDNSKSSHNSEDDFTIDEYITRYRTQRPTRSTIGNQHEQHNNSNHHHRQERHSNSHNKNDSNISKSYILGNHHNHHHDQDYATEDRIFLIDFGLASKFVDTNGDHRPFCMDQRRAHDGTLEFTSRDAHMGAHSRRSDLECLGYNLIFWSQGYLPWKEIAAQNQPEKVHWMKEYLMADVKEMLKHIYGKSVPKYLGEFMQYVGKLAYDERPDYEKCKRIFIREYIKLGFKEDNMKLDIKEMIKHSVDIKEEIENNNVFEMKNIKSIMKNLGMIMPFRESNSNRVSPKNLRSKSEKESKKKRKKFSWAEILSQDPDQIARERAEKEFERESTTETPLIKYSGKPTYAILQIENRLKLKDRLDSSLQDEHDDSSILIKGYTKPMMEILKKIQLQRQQQHEQRRHLEEANKKYRSTNHYSQQQQNNYHQFENQQQQNRYISSSILPTSFNGNHSSNENNHHHHHTNVQQQDNNKQQLATNINYINNSNHRLNNSKNGKSNNSKMGRPRAKAGLRTVITPTKRGLDYRNELIYRRTKRRLHKNSGDFTTDESSCSSLNSVSSSINNGTNKKSQQHLNHNTKTSSNRHKGGHSDNSSSGSNASTLVGEGSSSTNSSLSEDELHDNMVVFHSKKVIRNQQQHHSSTASAGAAVTAAYNHNSNNNHITTSSVNNNISSSSLMNSNNSPSIIQTRNKRKRSIPQKKNSKGELMRCV